MVIADEQFAVVAEADASVVKRIEPAEQAARLFQRCPETVGQVVRAKGIHEDANIHAAFAGAQEGRTELFRKRAWSEDVCFQAD